MKKPTKLTVAEMKVNLILLKLRFLKLLKNLTLTDLYPHKQVRNLDILL